MAAGVERVVVASPLAAAGGRVIASPFQFLVDGADHLRITSVNSLAGVRVAISGRWLNLAGSIEVFQHTHLPNTDRTVKREIFALSPGYLVNLTVVASAGAPRVGQTFVIIELVRGLSVATLLVGTLLQGYITSVQQLAWPGSPVVDSISGGGYLRETIGTDPGPGVEVVETVPTGARWEVVSFSVRLNTDSTAGARRVRLQFKASDNSVFAQIAQPGTQANDLGRFHNWTVGLPFDTQPDTTRFQTGLPTLPAFLAGAIVGTETINMVAGDDFTAPTLLVHEWLEAT